MAIHYVLQPKTRKQIRDLKLFHEVTLDNTSSGFPSAEVELVFNNEGIRCLFSFLFNHGNLLTRHFFCQAYTFGNGKF